MDSTDTKTASANGPASATGGMNGPGQVLRQARTDLRLNPEDVANQLHLAPRQILALEADDYEQLPQATYVRGYLRSYALFLGLSPEPIIDAYNRAITNRAPTTKRAVDRPKPGAEHEAQSKFGAFAVGGLILVLVIAWWQGRDADDRSRESAAAPTETPPPMASGTVPADPASPTASGTTPPPAAMDPAAGAAPATPPTAANAAPTPSAPAASTPSPPATAPAAPAPEAAATPPKPGPLPKNARQARLVLNASAESWVEVRDARDERLLYQTLPAGRVVGLEGIAPFRIFLGNAEGVAVAIDGEAYDASRHRRGNTARFSLSPPATAPAAPAPEPAADAPAPAPSESTAPPLLPE